MGASMMVNRCHENSETRSTSVVMSVMICALLEKSSSSSFLSSPSGDSEAAADATSLRTSVFAKRMELS